VCSFHRAGCTGQNRGVFSGATNQTAAGLPQHGESKLPLFEKSLTQISLRASRLCVSLSLLRLAVVIVHFLDPRSADIVMRSKTDGLSR